MQEMGKKLKQANYQSALELLFKVLDAAPVDPGRPIFREASDKEHYETLLMFALRKRQAGKYHLENVQRMIVSASKNIDKQMQSVTKSLGSKLYVVERSTSVLQSSEQYIHEVSAFLAALRSGLDFLAMVAGKSLPGITAHSIRTLMSMAEKGKKGAVVNVVKAHLDWLTKLKAYRDEVIHRLVIKAPVTGWTISQKGKTSKAFLPVVIPLTTPKLVMDTRLSRMMDEMMDQDVPIGLSRQESSVTVTYGDGTKKVIEHEIVFEPTDGYVPIETFMAYHLEAYDVFLTEIFTGLASINFQQPSV